MDDHLHHHQDYQTHLNRKELVRQRTALEAERRSHKRTSSRAEELERDVRFLTLMNRALLEVLDAGLIELEAFVETLEALDKGLDGVAGDGLAPEALAEELGVERSKIDKRQQWKRANRKGAKRRAIARIRDRFSD